jgi:hypothetical protein
MCPIHVSHVSRARVPETGKHFPTTLASALVSLQIPPTATCSLTPFLRSFSHLRSPRTTLHPKHQGVDGTWHILPGTGIHPLRTAHTPAVYASLSRNVLLPCHPGTPRYAGPREGPCHLATYPLSPLLPCLVLPASRSQRGCLRRVRHDVEVVWV